MSLSNAQLLSFSVIFAIRILSAQAYEVKELRDLMVPARDGIKLGTNVFLPVRGDPVVSRFPAIVERTPYNKDGVLRSLVAYFVSRGYAVVIQDVRGRYRSGALGR
jgi:predicted acyl esterase